MPLARLKPVLYLPSARLVLASVLLLAMQVQAVIDLAKRPLAPVTDENDPILSVVLAFKKESIQIVQANDMIAENLIDLGMATMQKFLPEEVGVEPGNRGTQGVNALAVEILAADILSVGWSNDATRHACCIRAKPGCSDIEDFTSALCKGNQMAPVTPGKIVAGANACTHTNMVLRNIAAAGPSTHPGMSADGRFSLARLEQKDPRYAKAVRTGLTWLCLDWRVKVWYPEVLDILQAARNIGQTLARQEDEMEVMLRLHALASEAQQKEGFEGVLWPTIKHSILRTRPPCEDKLNAMIQFVIARSGGIDGEHIRYLSTFFNNCVQPVYRKGVPASLYEALASFPLHFLALALLETAWLCPDAKVQQKECVWVTGPEIQALAKESKHTGGEKRLQAADKLVRGFRTAIKGAIAGSPGDWAGALIKELAICDAHVGRYILNKQVGLHVFNSLEQIADHFSKSIEKFLQGKATQASIRTHLGRVDEGLSLAEAAESPAATAKAKAKAKAAKAAARAAVKAQAKATPGAGMGLYEVNQEGGLETAIGKLRAKGWDIGSSLVLSKKQANCSEDAIFQVVSASGDIVTLNTPGADGQTTNVTVKTPDFLEQAKTVPSDRIVWQALWPSSRLAHSKAFAEASAKSRVMCALENLVARTCTTVQELVSIKLRPQKDVIAKRDLKAGELVLVPETTKITLVDISELKAALEDDEVYEDKVYPLEVFLTGLPKSLADKRMFLNRSTEQDACSPYWYAQPGKSTDETNLTEVLYHVQLLGGCDPWKDMKAPTEMVTPGLAAETCLNKAAPAVAKQTAIALAPPAKAQAALAVPAKAASSAKGAGKTAAKAGKRSPVAPAQAAGAITEQLLPASSTARPAQVEEVSPALATLRALVQCIQQYDGQGEIHERHAFVPVLVNSMPVKEGDALRTAPVEKTKPNKEKAISIKQALKKARVV